MSFFFLWNKYAAFHLYWCFRVSTIFALKIKSWDRNIALYYPYFYSWLKGQPLSDKKPVVKCRADSECLGRVIFFMNLANAETLLWRWGHRDATSAGWGQICTSDIKIKGLLSFSFSFELCSSMSFSGVSVITSAVFLPVFPAGGWSVEPCCSAWRHAAHSPQQWSPRASAALRHQPQPPCRWESHKTKQRLIF